MNQPDQDLIQLGLERRLSVVESIIPSRPRWRAVEDQAIPPAPVRVVAGPALRRDERGGRRLGLVLTVLALVAVLVGYGLVTGGGRRSLLPLGSPPSPTASSAEPVPSATDRAASEPGSLRPVVESRLTVPVRPRSAWTIVEDGKIYLDLAYFLEDVGAGGYNVGLSIFEPHGVYDPLAETKRLPLPADLIAWIHDHPDLDSEEPVQLTVAGLPATAIDVTVTYQPGGPKGQTAQFIDDGVGSWNLEFPSKKRIVLVQLPDRPLLIVFGSRPEFFDAAIGEFESELAAIEFGSPGPSP